MFLLLFGLINSSSDVSKLFSLYWWGETSDTAVNRTDEQLDAAVDELIALDLKLAPFHTPSEERHDFDRLYNLRRLSTMHELAPVVNERPLWHTHTAMMIVFRSIGLDFLLKLRHPNLPTICNLIPKLWSMRSSICKVWARWLLRRRRMFLPIMRFGVTRWVFILDYSEDDGLFQHSFMIALDSRFHAINDEFNKAIVGKEERTPRWRECIAETVLGMPVSMEQQLSDMKQSFLFEYSALILSLQQLAGAVWVRNKFSKADRRVAQTLIEELRLAFMWNQSVNFDFKVNFIGERWTQARGWAMKWRHTH